MKWRKKEVGVKKLNEGNIHKCIRKLKNKFNMDMISNDIRAKN